MKPTKPSKEEAQSFNSKALERLPKEGHLNTLSYERDGIENEVVVESERKKTMKETFGQRFSRLRKSRGLTQGDVAEKLNISGQAVSKWENDISAPDISILSDLADIFNVSIDTLLGREKEDVVKMDTEATDNASVEAVSEGEGQKEVGPVDTSKLVFKIKVISHDGDVVKVNLPIAIVKAMAVHGADGTLKIHGMGALDKVDLKQILDLAEHGVLGNLVNINSADGDVVKIYVGKSDESEEEDNKFRSGKKPVQTIIINNSGKDDVDADLESDEEDEEDFEDDEEGEDEEDDDGEATVSSPQIKEVRLQIKETKAEVERLKKIVKSGDIKDVLSASSQLGQKASLLASLSLRLNALVEEEENKKDKREDIQSEIDDLKEEIEEVSDSLAEGEITEEEGSSQIKELTDQIKELTDELHSV